MICLLILENICRKVQELSVRSLQVFFPEMAEEVDAIVPWWNGTDGTCELRH